MNSTWYSANQNYTQSRWPFYAWFFHDYPAILQGAPTSKKTSCGHQHNLTAQSLPHSPACMFRIPKWHWYCYRKMSEKMEGGHHWAAFDVWLKKYSFPSCKVAVAEFKPFGRGMKATAKIKVRGLISWCFFPSYHMCLTAWWPDSGGSCPALVRQEELFPRLWKNSSHLCHSVCTKYPYLVSHVAIIGSAWPCK